MIGADSGEGRSMLGLRTDGGYLEEEEEADEGELMVAAGRTCGRDTWSQYGGGERPCMGPKRPTRRPVF